MRADGAIHRLPLYAGILEAQKLGEDCFALLLVASSLVHAGVSCEDVRLHVGSHQEL